MYTEVYSKTIEQALKNIVRKYLSINFFPVFWVYNSMKKSILKQASRMNDQKLHIHANKMANNFFKMTIHRTINRDTNCTTVQPTEQA